MTTTLTIPSRDDRPTAALASRFPITIRRIDGFMTLHTASFDAVGAALPSDALHPVRLPNGRALIALTLLQKRASTAGSGTSTVIMPPYAELPISAIVARRPLSRAAAMLALARSRSSGLGGFALQFPLTSRAWRDPARSTLGSPMFVADFDLDWGGSEWRARVSENGQDILTVRVRPGGGLRWIRDTQTMFGVLDRRLMAVVVETEFVARRRRDGADLELGTDHPVADALRRLDLSRRAFMTFAYHDGRAILLAPVPVGEARPYPCHPGLDVPFGRYTIRYPGTPPIDQYAAGDLRRDPMAFDPVEGPMEPGSRWDRRGGPNGQAGTGSGAAESPAQRLTASVVRALTRVMLGPTFKAGHPIEKRRRRQARVSRLIGVPRGVEIRATTCGNVPGESVSVRGTAPAGRALLYLHGGGYCQGSPATHRTLTGHLARHCAAHVFAADYRLAPEHPFPAAVDDAVAAYRGLLAEGYAPTAIAIAGDSAGGGLAVATALSLRQLDLPQPAALVLFSPWVDLSLSALEPSAPGDIITKPFAEDCARTYLAGHPAQDVLASPIAADLHGLPPTLIQVGGDELLLADSRRLEAALLAAGVDVLLQVFPRRWHVFQLLAGSLADANRALGAVGEFVRGHTAVVGTGRVVPVAPA